MKTFKQCPSIFELLGQTKKMNEALVLFGFRFGYEQIEIAKEINMNKNTYAAKLKSNYYSASERCTINEFIRKHYK